MTDDWDRLLQDALENPSNEQQERDALDQAILDYINSDEIEKVVDSLLDAEMSDQEASEQIEQIMLDTVQGLMQKFSNSPELVYILNGMLHRISGTWIKMKFWANSHNITDEEAFRRKQIFNIYHARTQVLLLFYEIISGKRWLTKQNEVSLEEYTANGVVFEAEFQDYTGLLE